MPFNASESAPLAAGAAVARQWPDLSAETLPNDRRLADSELQNLRGGIRVNGLDLSIAARITTVEVGRIALTSELVVGDDGRWRAVASQVAALPSLPAPHASRMSKDTTTFTTASAPTPVQVALPAASTADTPLASKSGTGSASFQAAVGSSDSTQIVHQLANNNITSIVSNRVNGVLIDQTTVLNVNVKNFASFTATVGAAAHSRAFAADIARFR